MSTKRALRRREPAPADERRERTDREPVRAKRTPGARVHRGNACFGRQGREAIGSGVRGKIEDDPHLPRPRTVERYEPGARRPRPARGAEDDAVRLLDERGEADRAQRARYRAASGQAAQAEERAHEAVGGDRNPERRRDRKLRRAGNAQLVPLAHVVRRQELVEPRHALDLLARRYALAMATVELAEDAAERFLRYVQIDTQSDEDSESYPSTAKQLDLLRLLVDELKAIGLTDAAIDEHGYVTATLPSTVDHEVPAIAFFAHVDTAREASGAGVKPQRIRYDGGEITLGSSGQVIRQSESPQLAQHAGHDLITTDGTTLLGADDKSGIAEIMAAVAHLQAHPEIPHGPVKVAFNPDEEVGRGVIHFPVDSFGVVAAYTVDGSTAGEVQSETFSGAQVRMYIRGRAIHPGWAKGELVNAIKLAAAIVEKLPKDALSPETTDEREGYVHPVVISGDSTEVELRFIVRDFENDQLDEHVELLRGIAREVAATDERARSRSSRASSTATCATRSTSIPRSSRTSRRPSAASGSSRDAPRSAAAPTARR